MALRQSWYFFTTYTARNDKTRSSVFCMLRPSPLAVETSGRDDIGVGVAAYAPSHGLYVCACAANLDQTCEKDQRIVMSVRSAAASLQRAPTTAMLTVQK